MLCSYLIPGLSKLPPHPEIWIAEKKPSIAFLESNPATAVTEEEAQREGCSMCRWEAQQYLIIGQMCQEVLKKGEEEEEWY